MPRSGRCWIRSWRSSRPKDLWIADRNFCTTGLPLRDRRPRRLLRDPPARLDAALGVRREAAGLRPDRDRHGVRADDPGHERRGRGPLPAADHGGPGQADPGRRDRAPPPDQPAGRGRRRPGDRRSVPPALDGRDRLPGIGGDAQRRDQHAGLSQGGAVRLLRGVGVVQRAEHGQGGAAVGARRGGGGGGGLGLLPGRRDPGRTGG